MNDENPYRSPAATFEPNAESSSKRPWLLMRGGIAVTCFLVVALFAVLLAPEVIAKGGTGTPSAIVLWETASAILAVVAFGLISWGLTARRPNIEITGFLVLVPMLLTILGPAWW
jgi:hypothetical protein